MQLPGTTFRLTVFVQNPIPIALLKNSQINIKNFDSMNDKKKSLTYPLSPLSMISTSK